MLYLIVVSAVFLGALAKAQTFKVRVLDALNGKPYNDIPINYYCDRYVNTVKVTDSNGFAVIPYECKDGERIKIDTFIANGTTIWAGKVEECGWLEPQSIEQIMQVGVISKPTAAGGIWCPAKVSKNLKPIPGQVIIFVKKPTWGQSHVAP
jgi:hypothetical protein